MTQIPLSIVMFLIKFGELRFTPWRFLLPSSINSNVIARRVELQWHRNSDDTCAGAQFR